MLNGGCKPIDQTCPDCPGRVMAPDLQSLFSFLERNYNSDLLEAERGEMPIIYLAIHIMKKQKQQIEEMRSELG